MTAVSFKRHTNHKSVGRYLLLSIFLLIFCFTSLKSQIDMKDYFSIQLSDGTCVKSYFMDKEEFDSLISNADILTLEWDWYIFILKNGNVIVDFDHRAEKGTHYHRYGWYNSFEDLKKVQDARVGTSAEDLSLENAEIGTENMKTYFLIQLSDGSYVKSYSMDKEEFDSLSINADKYLVEWTFDIFILKNMNAIVHFVHTSPDGYISHRYGWYPCFEDFKRLQDDRPNRKDSHHYFEGYNPYNGDFSRKTEELIKTLMKDLSLDSENITLNEGLIKQVDKEIQCQEDPQIFMITHILNIVALVGEVFLAENANAEWYVERDARSETWMPKIKMYQSEEKVGTIDFVRWLHESMMWYEGNLDVVESSYLSLNDFKRLGLLTEER